MDHIAVVVSPLLTIIDEQVSRLQASGVKAQGITGEISETALKGIVLCSRRLNQYCKSLFIYFFIDKESHQGFPWSSHDIHK